jgi:hypothetical protein
MDFALRRKRYEDACYAATVEHRNYKLAHAKAFMQSEGSVDARNAQALIALEQDGSYQKLKEAEGQADGMRAAFESMKNEALIEMALLKAMKEAAGE